MASKLGCANRAGFVPVCRSILDFAFPCDKLRDRANVKFDAISTAKDLIDLRTESWSPDERQGIYPVLWTVAEVAYHSTKSRSTTAFNYSSSSRISGGKLVTLVPISNWNAKRGVSYSHEHKGGDKRAHSWSFAACRLPTQRSFMSLISKRAKVW